MIEKGNESMGKTLSSYPVQISLKTIISVVLFIIYTTINVSAVKGAYEIRIKGIEDSFIRLTDIIEMQNTRINNIEDNVKILQAESHTRELEYTEISTKLKNIESVLIEIKTRVNPTRI